LKIIAHRGNLRGKDLQRENKQNAIDECIRMDIDVEIDFWFNDGEFFLGHDNPETKIDETFLISRKKHLWIHAKNFEAVECLSLYPELNWFWHEDDKMTFTSKNKIWCYPGTYVKNGITVELGEKKSIPQVLGVCTDYPLSWL